MRIPHHVQTFEQQHDRQTGAAIAPDRPLYASFAFCFEVPGIVRCEMCTARLRLIWKSNQVRSFAAGAAP